MNDKIDAKQLNNLFQKLKLKEEVKDEALDKLNIVNKILEMLDDFDMERQISGTNFKDYLITVIDLNKFPKRVINEHLAAYNKHVEKGESGMDDKDYLEGLKNMRDVIKKSINNEQIEIAKIEKLIDGLLIDKSNWGFKIEDFPENCSYVDKFIKVGNSIREQRIEENKNKINNYDK